METEAIASAKAGEAISHAREFLRLRAFGTPPCGPTMIYTDNLANHKVGSGVGGPTRSISTSSDATTHLIKQRIRNTSDLCAMALR